MRSAACARPWRVLINESYRHILSDKPTEYFDERDEQRFNRRGDVSNAVRFDASDHGVHVVLDGLRHAVHPADLQGLKRPGSVVTYRCGRCGARFQRASYAHLWRLEDVRRFGSPSGSWPDWPS